jgi:Flp pilus assembly protein TadD
MAPLAREAAANAVRANADLSESQLATGYVEWLIDWNWTAAETALRRAISLDASNAASHRTLGHALSQAGKRDEAEGAMRRARELEPLDPINHALSAQVAFQNRDYDAAAEHARRTVLMAPAFWIGSLQLSQALVQQGAPDLALAALADAARFSGSNSKTTSMRGYILATQGSTAEARSVLRQMEDDARVR